MQDLRGLAERAPRSRVDGAGSLRGVAARPPLERRDASGDVSPASAAGATSTVPRTTTSGYAHSRPAWRFAKLPRGPPPLAGPAGAADPRTDPRYAPGRFLALKVAALEPRAARRWTSPGRDLGGGRRWARPGRAPSIAAGHHLVKAFVEVDPRRRSGSRIHGAPVDRRCPPRRASGGRCISPRSGQKGARASYPPPRPPVSGSRPETDVLAVA